MPARKYSTRSRHSVRSRSADGSSSHSYKTADGFFTRSTEPNGDFTLSSTSGASVWSRTVRHDGSHSYS